MSTRSPTDAKSGPITLAAFAVASAIGSALLFAVQPMVAKAHLPTLGGSPAVWITCSAFFQAALLAGYAYALVLGRFLGVRGQAAIQVGFLAIGLFFARTLVPNEPLLGPAAESEPSLWLIGRLLATVAVPFIAASASTTLLQNWFSKIGHRSAHDPYFLYGASNLGGLGALLAYPLVIEPNLNLSGQARAWTFGYGFLILMTTACALISGKRTLESPVTPTAPISLRRWITWAARAFVPSSLLLGVTTYLTTDVAAVPLFWVIPLAIYLLTFVIAFARRSIVPDGLAARIFPWAVVALMPALVAGLVQAFWIPLHLLVFASAALLCHGELARTRPPADRLALFYLAISFGGVLGGLFNAAVAPRIFVGLTEYPIAILLSGLALPGVVEEGKRLMTRSGTLMAPVVLLLSAVPAAWNIEGWGNSAVAMIGVVTACGLAALIVAQNRSRPLRFVLGLGAILVVGGLTQGVAGRPLLKERSFFGTLGVTQDDRLQVRRLIHGSTLHGSQSLDPARRREPLTYFARSGPLGRIFEALGSRKDWPIRNVAVAGLGVGTIAAYAGPGEDWTFFELDPAVARVAEDPKFFTFLSDCRARSLKTLIGDARLRMAESPDRRLDLIILDAFSSDAVPVHLLTREALRLYRSKLAEGGWIVFNITNRYVDLEPVLGALAAQSAMACRVKQDFDVPRSAILRGNQPSIWLVMAEKGADLAPLTTDLAWRIPQVRLGRTAWSDDFSDLGRCLVTRPVDRRSLISKSNP